MESPVSAEQSLFEDNALRIPARGGTTRVRLFNGTARRTNDWDGLRRDSKVWFEDGDCLVYFYGERASQRGASLKVPFVAVQQLRCKYLTDRCVRNRGNLSHSTGRTSRADGPYTRIRNDSDPKTVKFELYIPSPPKLPREHAFRYHLTTRNLLAYAVSGPVVGERLSIALVDLWRRIQEWKIPIQSSDFILYLEKQGYLDFTENTEHALACLKLAEEAHFRDVWIYAFVHCVGMHARLDLSPEFTGISNSTSALITRTSLEMDLHIGKVIRAVGSFLEEDLGPENLGLSKAARDHLDYFRSFLYGFYVNKFGYFPPQGTSPWNKRPWTSMYRDFQNLYEYLADTKSSCDWTNNQFSNGGICIIQNVRSFDSRHNLPSLQHPLPMLPVLPQKQRGGLGSHKSLRPLTLGKTASKTDPAIIASQALAAATNSTKTEVVRSPLVQEYQRFEKTKPDGKLDFAEARKIRWLLVYGVLQMLKSVVRAPPEVRDADTPSYPLCASIPERLYWENDVGAVQSATPAPKQSSNEKMLISQTLSDLEGRTSRVSIHPDCEADCADDFFASLNLSRHDSARGSIAPLSPQKRTSSLRSSMHLSVQALQKSVVGSLSRRPSIRRASTTLDLQKARPVCQILVEDYDSESDAAKPTRASQDEQIAQDLASRQPTGPWQEFNFGFAATDEPDTNYGHVKHPANSQPGDAGEPLPSPCESNFTSSSDESSDSKRSSYFEDQVDSPTTELSSWDGSRRGSNASNSSAPLEHQPPKEKLSYRHSSPNMNQKSRHVALNGGTYVPKGMLSKNSGKSSLSITSKPVYVEKTVGVGEARDRGMARTRRSRGLSGLSEYGIILQDTNVW